MAGAEGVQRVGVLQGRVPWHLQLPENPGRVWEGLGWRGAGSGCGSHGDSSVPGQMGSDRLCPQCPGSRVVGEALWAKSRPCQRPVAYPSLPQSNRKGREAGGLSPELQEQKEALLLATPSPDGWKSGTRSEPRAHAFLRSSFIHSSNSCCGHAHLHFSMTTPGQQGVGPRADSL